MASSDNVLRGGLTQKHVNLEELLRIVDFSPIDLEPLEAWPDARGEAEYQTPVDEFRLSRIELAGRCACTVAGPEILLCVDGGAELARLQLARGQSAFVSADVGSYELCGSGRLFRARVPG